MEQIKIKSFKNGGTQNLIKMNLWTKKKHERISEN
jgi:hypothetical protein